MALEVQHCKEKVWIKGKTGHMCQKGSINLPVTSIITKDRSVTNMIVFQCFYRTPTKQPTFSQRTAVHMISEQSGYEGNGQRRGEEVALD